MQAENPQTAEINRSQPHIPVTVIPMSQPNGKALTPDHSAILGELDLV